MQKQARATRNKSIINQQRTTYWQFPGRSHRRHLATRLHRRRTRYHICPRRRRRAWNRRWESERRDRSLVHRLPPCLKTGYVYLLILVLPIYRDVDTYNFCCWNLTLIIFGVIFSLIILGGGGRGSQCCPTYLAFFVIETLDICPDYKITGKLYNCSSDDENTDFFSLYFTQHGST